MCKFSYHKYNFKKSNHQNIYKIKLLWLVKQKHRHLPLKFLSEEKEQVNSKRNMDQEQQNQKNIEDKVDDEFFCIFALWQNQK